MNNTVTCNVNPNPHATIEFCIGSGQWIMKIERTALGALIKFNTEEFPDCMPDAFSKAVCEILCRSGYLDNIYKEFKRHES